MPVTDRDMDLTFTDAQIGLRDSVARFVSDYGISGKLSKAHRFRRDCWVRIAELGWLGAGLLESEGGFGGGPVEIMILLERLGYGLMPEPILQGVMASKILSSINQWGVVRDAHISGQYIVLPAFPRKVDEISCTISSFRGELHVSGEVRAVIEGPNADRLVILAATDSGSVALVCLDTKSPQLTADAYPSLDGHAVANYSFNQTPVSRGNVCIDDDLVRSAAASGVQLGRCALCAEATGISGFLFDQTLSYVKTRKQFGRTLGDFQALQHRLADMYIALEEARSLSLMAAITLQDDPIPRCMRQISAAKIGVLQRALHIAREAIQLHGGIGMTEELPIGAGFRRLKVLENLMGVKADDLQRMTNAPAFGCLHGVSKTPLSSPGDAI